MPSRRQFLRTLGAAGAATGAVATAGCVGRLPLPETGVLTYKAVRVRWRNGGRSVGATLAWVWSDGESRLFGWYPSEYPDVYHPPGTVAVSDALDARLRDDFEAVDYLLGFTRPDATGGDLLSGDWFRALASRRSFDRVQFGDAAAVTFGESRVRVWRVREGAVGPVESWDLTVRPMEFGEAYAHAGVPVA